MIWVFKEHEGKIYNTFINIFVYIYTYTYIYIYIHIYTYIYPYMYIYIYIYGGAPFVVGNKSDSGEAKNSDGVSNARRAHDGHG